MKKNFVLLIMLCVFIIKAKASSFIVLDMNNNNVILSNNKDEKRLIASISKIMTAIIIIEENNLSDEVIVDKGIYQNPGSSIYLQVDEKIKVIDLLYGMMLRSGNDAAYELAVYNSGSMENFSSKMNEYAKKIGMKNSFFINSTGLENNEGKGNVSSAYDMAILTSYAFKSSIFRKIFSTKKYECRSNIKSYIWFNKNKLLKYDYITGGKTGYTLKAKRTLVTTAKINDHDLVIVTLNNPDDWNFHLNKYNYIKVNYKNVKILKKGKYNIVDSNINLDYDFYIKKNIYALLSTKDKLKYENEIYVNYIKKKNKRIGKVNIYINNKLYTSEYIYIKKIK